MKKTSRIAVVGATGMVGRTFLSILYNLGYKKDNIYAVASQRSAGKFVAYGQDSIPVYNLETFDFSSVTFALFSPGSEVSKVYAPKAVEKGCIVIDNTSYFRMDPHTLLIIPEVNGHLLNGNMAPQIIANPNCVMIQLAVALKPIEDLYGIRSVNLTSLQAVSGAGKKAVDELLDHTQHYLTHTQRKEAEKFKKSIAFNVIPQIDTLRPDGLTQEEWKIRTELQKVYGKSFPVFATCVRVPVVNGHSISAHIICNNKPNTNELIKKFPNYSGIIYQDDIATPMEASDQDHVMVSRLRQDLDDPFSIHLWICADNLRKGAALNAIQIMQMLEDALESTLNTKASLTR